MEKKEDEMIEEISRKQNTIRELEEDYARLKEQVELEKQEFAQSQKNQLMQDVLNILDSVEILESEIEDTQENKSIKIVLKKINRDFANLLSSNNIKPIKITIGENAIEWEENRIEVVDYEESEREDGTIIEQVKKGYFNGNNIIRPSQVIVSQKTKVQQDTDQKLVDSKNDLDNYQRELEQRLDDLKNDSNKDDSQNTITHAEEIVKEISIQKENESAETVIEQEEGIIKWYNKKRGFGFVSRQKGDDLFLHESNIQEDVVEGDKIQFEIGKNEKGPTAINVKKIGD